MGEVAARAPERLRVPMSDGGTLSVLRFACGDAAAPAVLQVTPYRKERPVPDAWRIAERGYNVFKADVRGFGGSRGAYSGIFSEREIQDGVELIEWIARQPFCNGKVGMIGGSYTGANQMLIAARRPKPLACIMPTVGPVDIYRDWNWRGGIPSFVHWAMNYFNAGREEIRQTGLQDYYFQLLRDGLDNEQHRARSAEYRLGEISIPTFLVGGWDDYFLRGTIRAYLKIPAPRRLLVGPWGHPNAGDPEETDRWLDYWLKGEGSDPTQGRAVRLFRTGSNDWIERDKWFDYRGARWRTWRPFEGVTEWPLALNFHAAPPATNVRTIFDFASGFAHWPEIRTIDSEPFEGNTDIDGQPAMEVEVEAGDCSDFECHVRLSVVKTDGTVQQLTEGRLRASHRAIDLERSFVNEEGYPIVPWHVHRQREKLTAGAFTSLHLEINPVCHRFFAGERLRLGMSLLRADGGDAPSTVRLGTGTRVFLPVSTGVE